MRNQVQIEIWSQGIAQAVLIEDRGDLDPILEKLARDPEIIWTVKDLPPDLPEEPGVLPFEEQVKLIQAYVIPPYAVGEDVNCGELGNFRVTRFKTCPIGEIPVYSRKSIMLIPEVQAMLWTESSRAVQYWLDVGVTWVKKNRRFLGVPASNKGTLHLKQRWAPFTLANQGNPGFSNPSFFKAANTKRKAYAPKTRPGKGILTYKRRKRTAYKYPIKVSVTFENWEKLKNVENQTLTIRKALSAFFEKGEEPQIISEKLHHAFDIFVDLNLKIKWAAYPNGIKKHVANTALVQYLNGKDESKV